MARRPRLLLIDDDGLFLRTMARALSHWCEVLTARDLDEARAAAGEDADLVLCDLHLGATDAVALLRELDAAHPGLLDRAVIVTGGDFDRRLSADPALAARPRLEKPFHVDAVLALLDIDPRHPA